MLTLEYLQNRLNGQLKGISKPSAQYGQEWIDEVMKSIETINYHS